MRRILAVIALAATALTAGTATTGGTVEAAKVCKDSNGAAPGGHVYWPYSQRVSCNLVRPQQLHLTGTPSKKACVQAGGTGWVAKYRICWNVDY